MKNSIKAFLILGGFILFSEACKSKKTVTEKPVVTASESTCGSATYTYTANVKAIIDKHCALSCHSAAKSAGGYDLSSYEQMTKGSLKLRLIGSVKHLENFSAMPMKNPKLSDSTIQILDCWVKGGMLK